VVSSEDLTEQPDWAPQRLAVRRPPGLSNIADADSESVEQLVEEGQAMEADAIAGVEDARTRTCQSAHAAAPR